MHACEAKPRGKQAASVRTPTKTCFPPPSLRQLVSVFWQRGSAFPKCQVSKPQSVCNALSFVQADSITLEH